MTKSDFNSWSLNFNYRPLWTVSFSTGIALLLRSTATYKKLIKPAITNNWDILGLLSWNLPPLLILQVAMTFQNKKTCVAGVNEIQIQ